MADGSKEINTFLDQIIGYVNGLSLNASDDLDKKVLRHFAMNMHSVKAHIVGLENQNKQLSKEKAEAQLEKSIDALQKMSNKKNKVVLSPQDDRTFRAPVKVDDEPIEKPESD